MGLVHEGVTLTNAIAESIQASKLHQVREYPVISPLWEQWVSASLMSAKPLTWLSLEQKYLRQSDLITKIRNSNF